MAERVLEPLTRADAAWLHAEAPTNHFVVTSLALLDEPADPQRVLSLLDGRLDLHPKLRQVVEEPLLPGVSPRWRPATDFDLRAHVHRVGLPAPGGRRELEAFTADLAGLPLDFGRPLWEVFLVEGPGSGGAVVSRFHHALGDGQAMVKMLLTLTDRTPGGWRRRPPGARRPSHRSPSGLGALVGTATAAATHVLDAPNLVRDALGMTGTFARLTLMDPDPATPLRGDLSMLKRVAWSRPFRLAEVKRIARRGGATINDVVVSSIAGALGAYLAAEGVEVGGLRLRAMVPVNLRPADDLGMSENRFSLIYLELPVGVRDPWERVHRVRHEMSRIKGSDEAAVGWLMLRSMGLLPPRVEQVMAGFYADKASLVLTNVIGPRHPLYLAGVRIREMTFWEPESGGLGVGVSIFSYAGQLIVGIISDANLVNEPGRVIAGFEKAFSELAARRPESR
jgi:diacylglycerol O-acyltransferase / wax synthase